jgi:dTDP-4-dehydrorhamnose reductase
MPLELWGGHEQSVVRTGDIYYDQTIVQGHQDRIGDLELFASLGIKALRYPVLWERVSPNRPDQRDFSWEDQRLRAIRKLGIKPIIGLLHHGSGPRYTGLLDPDFASGLAAHARACAERYAWVDDWNPVNEPLTTARFSCLNGAWYPEKTRDEGAFWLALLNEVNGVRLSMRAIREVNPRARLIQTDDLGYSHATPALAEQAEFENHRRWITWDLLCGRVVPGHPLWARIAASGHDRRLGEIADDPCPPQVIGANYYAASERVLDQRLGGYAGMAGQDGPGDYANADAARSIARPLIGLEGLLTQAWERYGIPLAVTETHNVGSRDEQMRWILETWRSCERLRQDGVRVEAVTAWALLGSFDWKTLGVEQARRYEVGVWDIGSGEPRATALVPLLRALSRGEEPPPSPAFASPGWWRNDERFGHDTEGRKLKRVEDLIPAPDHRPQSPPVIIPSRPILITGLTGTLGRGFDHCCHRRGLPHVMTERAELQLEDRPLIDQALRKHRPYAVINAAG